VFALLSFDDVNLPTARRESSSILPFDSKKYQFGGVSKIKTDAATIGTAVLS
jgi:hypothetical protein